jgi:hypothetical protein
MSTLKVTNIQATGETATRAVSGVAAAWVNFDQYYTNTIADSVNISSSSDDGTGQTTHNFISLMSDASYHRIGDGWSSANSSEYNTRTESSGRTMTNASWKKVHVINNNAAAYADVTNVFLLIHGDLA